MACRTIRATQSWDPLTSKRKRARSRRPAKQSSEAAGDHQGIEAHGWTLLAHPLFLDQLEKLITAVEREERGGRRYRVTANQKVLAAIVDLAFEEIPRDPARKDFRQGDTLGPSRKHWFRAKFGSGRFRLFFRYRSDARIIVYAWVNDSETLRTYGSRSDAYAVFAGMLDSGNPPDEWDDLVKSARGASPRLAATKKRRRPS